MARSTMKLISFLFAVFAYQTGIEGKKPQINVDPGKRPVFDVEMSKSYAIQSKTLFYCTVHDDRRYYFSTLKIKHSSMS